MASIFAAAPVVACRPLDGRRGSERGRGSRPAGRVCGRRPVGPKAVVVEARPPRGPRGIVLVREEASGQRPGECAPSASLSRHEGLRGWRSLQGPLAVRRGDHVERSRAVGVQGEGVAPLTPASLFLPRVRRTKRRVDRPSLGGRQVVPDLDDGTLFRVCGLKLWRLPRCPELGGYPFLSCGRAVAPRHAVVSQRIRDRALLREAHRVVRAAREQARAATLGRWQGCPRSAHERIARPGTRGVRLAHRGPKHPHAGLGVAVLSAAPSPKDDHAGRPFDS